MAASPLSMRAISSLSFWWSSSSGRLRMALAFSLMRKSTSLASKTCG
jgi:hypothetical protein